jgi:hypothetical protein
LDVGVGALLRALGKEHHTTVTRLILGEVLFELGEPERAAEVLADADASADGEQEKLATTMARTFNLFWGCGRTEEALALNDAARRLVTGVGRRRTLRYNEAAIRTASGEAAALALLNDLPEDIRQEADPLGWLTAAMMKPSALELSGRSLDAVAWAAGQHLMMPGHDLRLQFTRYPGAARRVALRGLRRRRTLR